VEECETGPANDGRRINVASWVALHLVPCVLFAVGPESVGGKCGY
jgi:hypothetical protein